MLSTALFASTKSMVTGTTDRESSRYRYSPRLMASFSVVTKPSRGKDSILGIVRCNQHNINIPMQTAMLKAVVEQVQLRTEFAFGVHAGVVTFFTNNYRNLEFACDQERLIAEAGCRSGRINLEHAPGFPSITAGKHVKADAALLEVPP